MARSRVDLSWQFREDNDDLHYDITETPDDLQHRKQLSHWATIAVSVIFVFTLLTVTAYATIKNRIEAYNEATREAIAETAHAEAWIWYSASWNLLPDLVDQEARRQWVIWYRNYDEGLRNWAGDFAQAPIITVERSELLEPDIALASMRITRSEVPGWIIQRESRFYRLVDGNWLRTAPRPELWGDPRVLETGMFRFEYRSRDQATVEEVGRQIDALYAHMRQALELPPLDGDNGRRARKLVVQIVPGNAGLNKGEFVGGSMSMSAPELLRAPEEYTDAEIVLEHVAGGLADRVVEEYLAGSTIDPNWRAIEQGVRRWLATDALRYVGASSLNDTASLEVYVGANGFPGLDKLCCCRYLRLSDSWVTPQPSQKCCTCRYSRWLWASDWVNQAGESMVTYGMSEYGSDRAPVLLDGLTRYKTLEELIPSVFSTSVEEFDAAWQSRAMTELGLGRDER